MVARPKVMGILNVTPDSFSDGGLFRDRENAVRRGILMAEEGAAILDIGGESTRPGASPVSLDEELERVIPVIEKLAKEVDIPISIDTYKPEVMREAVKHGARMINDIKALQMPGAMETARELQVPVCLMHMQGSPDNMQKAPYYEDGVIAVLHHFFEERIEACVEAGVPRSQLLLDPGFGFGKTTRHNLEIIRHLESLKIFEVPILIGVSRKSSIGEILGGKLPQERLSGSLAMAVLAAVNGASILRVHDVKETVQAMVVVYACAGEE